MNKVSAICALHDNYIWAIHDSHNTQIAVVDPGDADPVLSYLNQHQLTLHAILITHRHHDHTGGVAVLAKHYPTVKIYAPVIEHIPVTDHVANGSQIDLFNQQIKLSVIAIPGHTLEHIAFYGHQWLFSGDTLFSMGCGRIFEGTPAQMLESLMKLTDLPDDTLVYCGHEYTEKNLRFALMIEPNNKNIGHKLNAVMQLRAAGLPSLPSKLIEEKQLNPFLRCNYLNFQKSLQQKVAQPLDTTVSFFTALRKLKDAF